MHFLCTFPFWWCTLKKYQHVITSVMIFCSYPVITNTMFHLLKFIVYIYWCLIVWYWMSFFYVWPTSTFWSVIFFSYVDIQRMDKQKFYEFGMAWRGENYDRIIILGDLTYHSSFNDFVNTTECFCSNHFLVVWVFFLSLGIFKSLKLGILLPVHWVVVAHFLHISSAFIYYVFLILTQM